MLGEHGIWAWVLGIAIVLSLIEWFVFKIPFRLSFRRMRMMSTKRQLIEILIVIVISIVIGLVFHRNSAAVAIAGMILIFVEDIILFRGLRKSTSKIDAQQS